MGKTVNADSFRETRIRTGSASEVPPILPLLPVSPFSVFDLGRDTSFTRSSTWIGVFDFLATTHGI